VYRAVDQHGQVIDVLVCARRDAAAARRFFRRAMTALKVRPTEVGQHVVADRADGNGYRDSSSRRVIHSTRVGHGTVPDPGGVALDGLPALAAC